ncbi:helix-turn-helix domain-containing protein [Hungatella hathewayi]|uniref:helix-turn-helix domain-containing protein n=1 Tax=Hungatella hathewayi TaxID=154046 RepID=UPI000E47F38E|nr:helix-turn-helix transcriptional regulator [Hungatella hathewayi]RHB60405.1 XRE family transcriptional regulator [Hungatella hathewayi]
MGVNEYIQIGTRIKRLRLEKRLSQKAMAEKLRIPYSTYSNYENNNREPNYETIKNIAEVLGITVEYLLNGETGLITADTAKYLITLSGFDMESNRDGTYTISDIQNNSVVAQTTVTTDQLKEIVKATSEYIEFLVRKQF